MIPSPLSSTRSSKGEVPGEDTSNEWLEPVTDEEYDKLK